jgi:hypothetical protein
MLAVTCTLAALLTMPQDALSQVTPSGAVPVTVDNFIRAESDMYMGNMVKEGGLGKLVLASTIPNFSKAFGTPKEVDPVRRLVGERLQRRGLLPEEHRPRLHAQQPHGQEGRQWRHHDPVRRLSMARCPTACPSLPAGTTPCGCTGRARPS